MAPQWRYSAGKHQVSKQDASYVMLHPSYVRDTAEQPLQGGVIAVFIGLRHAQALPDDEIEILVEHFPQQPGREAVVFHVQPLSAKWRRYREENP